MNDKEIGEIRRRIKKDKCAVPYIYGAFINEKKELVSTFRQNVAMLSADDANAIFKIMRKMFSGTLGKNLLDVSFSTEDVMSGEEHKMLMEMRKQSPESEPYIRSFFERTAETLSIQSSYIVLLAQDRLCLLHAQKFERMDHFPSHDRLLGILIIHMRRHRL